MGDGKILNKNGENARYINGKKRRKISNKEEK